MPIDPQELEDLITDVMITDFRQDWIPRDAARAIVSALASEGWAVVERASDAAPDLLEALRDCADDLEAEIEARRACELPRRIERDLDTVRRARAAIAKAEGQPEDQHHG